MTLITPSTVEPLAPDHISDFILPTDEFVYSYSKSPEDWADEILYFLLPDRFSDEDTLRPLLNREKLKDVRGTDWSWEKWAQSGKYHFQGGTIKGMEKRLDYLKNLGITAIWVAPVFKQRDELDTYHGYGIQNFLEVDPRFGTRQDLVDFVKAAHKENIRVILDIVFNHMGANFTYQDGKPDTCIDGVKDGIHEAKYKPRYDGQVNESDYAYQKIDWVLDIDNPGNSKNDMVFPIEFQNKDYFTRAGTVCDDLGAGAVDDPFAAHKRTDFLEMRDFDTDTPSKKYVLDNLIKVYQYWIALTDCDGFRIDTTKHVTWEAAKSFCGAIKEYAQKIGKDNFFLVAETTGGGGFSGEIIESYYLDALGQNLNAALDIGDMKNSLSNIVKDIDNSHDKEDPQVYFKNFRPGGNCMGSHRSLRNKHVSILDQHDDHIRFTSSASSNHQIVAATALQLFTLGIPCIYYGTEQAFAGPEESERYWLINHCDRNLRWGESDIYTREAMFGPKNPIKCGKGFKQPDKIDEKLPGFGPFGTCGQQCFDETHPAYKRIAALTAVRQSPKYPALRKGRQYLRAISIMDDNPTFMEGIQRKGELVAWSRIISDEEIVCVVNCHDKDRRGAKILVDAKLSSNTMYVIANTEEIGTADYAGYPVRSTVKVQKNGEQAFIEILNVGCSEVIVLANHQ